MKAAARKSPKQKKTNRVSTVSKNSSKTPKIPFKKLSAHTKSHHKYIFVIGGVMSGVGKGIATSSIGTLRSSANADATSVGMV